MNFKKISTSDNQWHDVPYYQHKTATDTLTLPAVIYPNDTSITVGIKGQSSQSGTPSPSNPVDVLGCGERTAQLIPEIVQGGVSTDNGSLSNSSNRVRTNYIPVESGKTYAVSSGNIYLATGCYYNNGVFSSKINEVVGLTTSATFTVPENVNQIAIGFRTANGTTDITPSDLQNYMLNEGSSALPYEPYGYKIQISSASTTTPVYLGEEETTRRIKKYEITGNERWVKEPLGDTPNRYHGNDILTDCGNNMQGFCSHYIYAVANNYGNIFIVSNKKDIFVLDSDVTSAQALSEYFAQQYAAGTPVTVWYVLATEETAVVNEPLMKIGDYSDSLTTSIPCTAGENTLDVQTTVAPSEVTAGFSGWHPVSAVHERENGAWT